jgi:hypothetical protein
MGNKSKSTSNRSTATLDLGKERKKRIAKFCAIVEYKDGARPTIEGAVNQLIDESLDRREIKAESL